jgi:very-short-patch-repair endonuclease
MSIDSTVSTTLIQKQLDESRRELLDLSTRNRLISIPIGSKSARLIQIFDEKSEEAYRRLVTDKKNFTFLASKGQLSSTEGKSESSDETLDDDSEQLVDLIQPDDEADPLTGKAKRHIDSRLQTRLSPELLHRRLFDLHNEARTIIEEQGVNILYLAIGYLKWIDTSNNKTERFAPLLLIPVDLIRQSVSDRFAIKWREEDLQDNLSLAEKLSIEFGVTLPLISSEENDSFDLDGFFKRVRETIAPIPGWSVEVDSMCIGFFSFAKFLMYKDLDSASWPELNSPTQHSLIRRLLRPDVESYNGEGLNQWTGKEKLDELLPVVRLDHVVDADSSQTIAIELVREGRNLVIQGPPGTGKSQTITNIIATAVLDGKKVLFVAEKLAALEVVKLRLEKEGLGVLCLELHSNKAKKSAVANELKLTWELGCPSAEGLSGLNDSLSSQRNNLNDHANKLHHSNQKGQSAFDHLSSLTYYGLPQGDETGISFQNAEYWDSLKIAEQELVIKDLVTRMEVVGDVLTHPWRGVYLTHYTGLERQSIQEVITRLINNLEEQVQVTNGIADALNTELGDLTMNKVGYFQVLGELAIDRPISKLDTINSHVWDDAPKAIVTLSKTKQRFEEISNKLNDQVLPGIWKKDWSFCNQQLGTSGQRWYKFLLSDYKAAMKQMASDIKIPLPSTYEQKVELVNEVLEGQQAFEVLQSKSALGQQAFGGLWEEENIGQLLVNTAEWIDRMVSTGLADLKRENFLKADIDQITNTVTRLDILIADYQKDWQWLEKALLVSTKAYFDEDLFMVNISDWRQVLVSCRDSLDKISDWVSLRYEFQKGLSSKVSPLIELLEKGKVLPQDALPAFRRTLAYQQLGSIFQKEPDLASFNGEIHNQKVTAFKHTDLQRLNLAKVNVLTKHYQHIPAKLPAGAVGTLLGEVNKQRSHRPIRQLISQAGLVIQDIKPVFMMSPLSVAQFLEPGKIEFDLLVIDEASQVKPVDALGAIARCRQLVVVGDDKQLPPSNFFSKLTSNDGGQDTDDDEADAGLVKATEMESVLSLAKARGLIDTLLRWHYRSKHHSLIAVSNKRYYENKLYVVPSPWKQNAGLGLVWRPVNGVYDRSNTRTNSIEAKAVAEAVINHAQKYPNETLGVAAFSMSQQRAIQDEVERLRRTHSECESFFSKFPYEGFFIKNLENVQGDERDVIFLSVGYGRDIHGKISMNFGPLNRQGGERRLNVLISRARKRCEVFSSISDQDIEITTTTGEGVAGLKQFLHYTRTGQLNVAEQSSRPIGSPFEEAVKEALEARFGWEVHTQIGEAGFFIDLAIVDPEKKGRYVIGIECDGVAYHSSPSARERDRLRQSILENQGWIIHRLWGIDFFRKKDEEVDKIKTAYDAALETLTENDRIEIIVPEEENIFHLTRKTEEESSFAVPYQIYSTPYILSSDPYTLYAPQIGDIVHEILKVESPMHFDELTTRMREQWGWAKAGKRFRALVNEGLINLKRDNLILRDGNFVTLKSSTVAVRERGDGSPLGTRKPVNIPPSEIDLSLLHIVKSAKHISREEAAKAVSILLGFKAISTEFRGLINDQINGLLGKMSCLR